MENVDISEDFYDEGEEAIASDLEDGRPLATPVKTAAGHSASQ